MHVEKLNENLRIFENIKQEFPSNTKRKKLFLEIFIVLDPDINLKEMDQKFPFGGLIWRIRKFLYGLIFHTSKSLDYMQLYMTLLDL